VPPERIFNRIVSLSPSTTEIVAMSAAAGPRLVGRTAACNFPPDVARLPVVANVKPDFEAIRERQAELILFDADLYSPADVARMRELGATTFSFGATTIDEFLRELYRMGDLIGAQTMISEYADRIYRTREARRAVPYSPTPRAAMVLAASGGEHMIAGANSFQGDVLRALTLDPVGPGSERFEPLDAEFLIAQNPDIIFTAGDPGPLLADARLRTVRAVAAGRVVGLNQDVALRRGSRVDRLLVAMQDAITQLEEGGAQP
jgi:iron complex transport system substrate-binding protein